MFCKKCGKENDNDANFCIYCGNSLSSKNDKVVLEKSKNVKVVEEKINKDKPKYYLIRCFFGYTLMLGFIINLFEDSMPMLGALSYGLLGFTISPIGHNKLYGKKRLILGFIFFVMTGLTGPGSAIDKQNKSHQTINKSSVIQENIKTVPVVNNQEKNQNETKKQTPVEVVKPLTNEVKNESAMLSNDKIPPLPKKIDVKLDETNDKTDASYNPKILGIVPLEKGKGWDKTINKYGINGVKKINELLPKAAELMSKNPTCDKLAYVAHSDKGNPDNIIIFGDCNNGARFYLSEKEIAQQNVPLSKRQKLEKMELQLMNACDEIVKSHLTHPSTFDKSIFRSGVTTDEYKTTVLVGFSAKNSFNLELKYKAICIFNDTPELVDFAIEEE